MTGSPSEVSCGGVGRVGFLIVGPDGAVVRGRLGSRVVLEVPGCSCQVGTLLDFDVWAASLEARRAGVFSLSLLVEDDGGRQHRVRLAREDLGRVQVLPREHPVWSEPGLGTLSVRQAWARYGGR